MDRRCRLIFALFSSSSSSFCVCLRVRVVCVTSGGEKRRGRRDREFVLVLWEMKEGEEWEIGRAVGRLADEEREVHTKWVWSDEESSTTVSNPVASS